MYIGSCRTSIINQESPSFQEAQGQVPCAVALLQLELHSSLVCMCIYIYIFNPFPLIKKTPPQIINLVWGGLILGSPSKVVLASLAEEL